MRYHFTHPFANSLCIMFNGEYQSRVLECDDEAGWIRRYVTPDRIVNDAFVTEVLFGQVDVYVNARHAMHFVGFALQQKAPPKLMLTYNGN